MRIATICYESNRFWLYAMPKSSNFCHKIAQNLIILMNLKAQMTIFLRKFLAQRIKMENVFDRKSLSMTILMTPELSNFSGVVHGGHIMRMLDQVAYACATRYCGVDVVTVYVDNISFKHPIPIGNLVTFLASVNYTGKSSMEVGIKVIAEDIKNRTATHTNTSYFTMVALDPDGVPFEVEPLVPETEEQKRRYEAAQKRKKARVGK